MAKVHRYVSQSELSAFHKKIRKFLLVCQRHLLKGDYALLSKMVRESNVWKGELEDLKEAIFLSFKYGKQAESLLPLVQELSELDLPIRIQFAVREVEYIELIQLPIDYQLLQLN